MHVKAESESKSIEEYTLNVGNVALKLLQGAQANGQLRCVQGMCDVLEQYVFNFNQMKERSL